MLLRREQACLLWSCSRSIVEAAGLALSRCEAAILGCTLQLGNLGEVYARPLDSVASFFGPSQLVSNSDWPHPSVLLLH